MPTFIQPAYRQQTWKLFVAVFSIPLIAAFVGGGFYLLTSWLNVDQSQPLLGPLRLEHLGAILILFTIATTFFGLWKLGLLSPAPSVSTLPKAEKRAFGKKYGSMASDSSAKKLSLLWIVLCLLFLGFVTALILLSDSILQLSETVRQVIMYGAVGLMIMVFYRAVASTLTKDRDSLLDFLNTREIDTQLQGDKTSVSGGGYGLNLSWKFSGLFRGRKLDFSTHMEATRVGNTVSTSGSATIYLEMSSSSSFSISEKNPHWEQISGSSIEDCFEQRFEVTGNKALISSNLKELLLSSPRYFSAKVEKGSLTYSCSYSEEVFFPFYSNEGIALYLDFLNQVCEKLEKNSNT
ncbi:MAG: hypothetical protein Q8P95_02450 [bacterium]|nr:hypothetical protein [bacterium]